MICKSFKDIQLSGLGMGAMRLPMKDEDHIDYEKAHAIFEEAYEAGINYYDTAYVYNGGDSERCLGAWLGKHPRDSFYIASKFNVNANPDYVAVFEEQLERLQTDHIDFYLIHCLKDHNIDKYIDGGAVAYFQEQNRLGRISYLGFSTHADLATLTRFADYAPWDFAQIQMNYYDWVYGTAAKEYEILAQRNIPIMVMEPVRGGRLASLTPEVEAMLKAAQPDWSMAAWALRFVKSHPQVQVILSGMSNLEQLRDNLNTFADGDGLSQQDMATLMEAGALFRRQIYVPCTECRYCTAECPMSINIPAFMKLYNNYKIHGPWALNGVDKIETQGQPGDCVACGACMGHCPQDIRIPKILAELAEALAKR